MSVDIIIFALSFIIGMRVGVWAYKEDIKMGRQVPPKRNFD